MPSTIRNLSPCLTLKSIGIVDGGDDRPPPPGIDSYFTRLVWFISRRRMGIVSISENISLEATGMSDRSFTPVSLPTRTNPN